jgi:soluble lytic murein transglycosylase-like protein
VRKALRRNSHKRKYTKAELVAIAEESAKRHGLRPALFKAQIRQESGFNPHARSRVGAQGIAQIMPGTARAWRVNPMNPVAALNVAARNMARYVRTYRNQGHDQTTSEKLALAAYNAGPGAVAKHKKVPPFRETQQYVRAILGAAGTPVTAKAKRKPLTQKPKTQLATAPVP